MEDKKIKVKTFYDKETKDGLGVELPDGTIVLVNKETKGLRLAFPKDKFVEMFKAQEDSESNYLEIEFDEQELEIIYKVIGNKQK